MYKKATEDLVRAKVEELLRDHHWRRVCLLILLLPKCYKLVSKYFIYDKIQKWGLWNPSCNQEIDTVAKYKANTLATISKTLQSLSLDGYLRKEDLGRTSLSQIKFEKICEKRVLGRPEQQELMAGKKWIQAAFKLSPDGRRLARKILFPPKRKKLSLRNFFRLKRVNRKPTACA
ncbi:MAG: hypothetical protein UR66_C0005G0088 [Candidatus Moranbacteria bacterium GW2011_GWE1_35_17]|nr:MAG: hypothetical protein UR66_C0005G0088 [Candidatus Moranbacteria bacterium GW2011_GWE1_35_17]KKP81520.1 MAG: hypothetical protein UR82_C0059G0009 [Candidatus Moranbacteria bacterium GW2011_GWF1_35_5]